MKYKIEEYPNPHRIGVHLTKKLTEEMIISFHSAKSVLDQKDYTGEPVDEDVRLLAGALYQIDGINDVTIKPYHISIGKGECFEWQDIEPEVIRTINVMVAPNENMEVLPRITMSDAERKRIQKQFDREMQDFLGFDFD